MRTVYYKLINNIEIWDRCDTQRTKKFDLRVKKHVNVSKEKKCP